MTSLAPRLLKGLQAEYIEAEYDGDPGLTVYGRNVLVKSDACAPQTTGGVHVIDDQVERMTLASETGVICGVGPDAFRHLSDGTPWESARPEVGERIYFERYAGILARGGNGEVYRIMDCNCIAAGLKKEPA